jgi:hypothetical protein
MCFDFYVHSFAALVVVMVVIVISQWFGRHWGGGPRHGVVHWIRTFSSALGIATGFFGGRCQAAINPIVIALTITVAAIVAFSTVPSPLGCGVALVGPLPGSRLSIYRGTFTVVRRVCLGPRPGCINPWDSNTHTANDSRLQRSPHTRRRTTTGCVGRTAGRHSSLATIDSQGKRVRGLDFFFFLHIYSHLFFVLVCCLCWSMLFATWFFVSSPWLVVVIFSNFLKLKTASETKKKEAIFSIRLTHTYHTHDENRCSASVPTDI